VAGVCHGGCGGEDRRRSLPIASLLRSRLRQWQYHAGGRSDSVAGRWAEVPNPNTRCSLQCLEGTPWVFDWRNGRHWPEWPSWWGRKSLPILRRTCVELSTKKIFLLVVSMLLELLVSQFRYFISPNQLLCSCLCCLLHAYAIHSEYGRCSCMGCTRKHL